MTEKKQKILKLGSIMKGQYGSFISLDPSIKEVVVTKEYKNKEGKLVKENFTIARKDDKYLSPFNINKVEVDVARKLENGWIDEKKAEELIQNAKKYNISSYVTVKVED